MVYRLKIYWLTSPLVLSLPVKNLPADSLLANNLLISDLLANGFTGQPEFGLA
jgi:hypothetical protein